MPDRAHSSDCRWERTTEAECEYRATHHYCPHAEHACTCAPARAVPKHGSVLLDVVEAARELVESWNARADGTVDRERIGTLVLAIVAYDSRRAPVLPNSQPALNVSAIESSPGTDVLSLLDECATAFTTAAADAQRCGWGRVAKSHAGKAARLRALREAVGKFDQRHIRSLEIAAPYVTDFGLHATGDLLDEVRGVVTTILAVPAAKEA